jgi:hypothetical protein
MSFGFSVSDFLHIIGLARTTYNNCLNAPREFHEAGRETGSLYAILDALKDEVDDPESPLLHHEQRTKDFARIVTCCRSVLSDLDQIVAKYSTLGTDNARMWHRFRFPHKEVGELRNKLTCHTNMLSTFLDAIGLGTLGRVEKRLDAVEEQSVRVHERLTSASDCVLRIEQNLTDAETLRTQMDGKLDKAASERREILMAVHDLGSQFRAGTRENSVLTAHTDDSKFDIHLRV